MHGYNEEYLNIYGRSLILTYSKIGKSFDGCQFTIKFKEKSRNHLIFFIFILLPLLVIILNVFNLSKIYFYSFLLLILAIPFYRELFQVQTEKILMIPSVGVQYTIIYGFKLEKNVFIHWEHIDGIIINEVIHRQRIIYILTVLVKNKSNETSLVTLLQETKPRLQCLQIIYQEIQNIIDHKKNSS